MNKIKVGVPGLDTVLKGGVNEGTSVLVAGAPGTGKSIIALQFIYAGAKNNEPGLFITSEDSLRSFRIYAQSLGFDLEKFEKQNLITLVEQPVSGGHMITIEAPLNLIKKKKIKRVALDSLSLFEYVYKEDEFKKGVIGFLSKMKSIGVTFFATSERATTDLDTFDFKAEDFLFDGLILLSRVRKGASFERVVTVAKMRGQEHMMNIYPLSISKGGVKIFPEQIPFSLIEKSSKK